MSLYRVADRLDDAQFATLLHDEAGDRPACGGCCLPARPGASAGKRWIESARGLLRDAGWRAALFILRSRAFGRNDARPWAHMNLAHSNL